MSTVAGRYEIKAKLGEGGMGVVYRAYDPAPMDREVAVKTLHQSADPFLLDLFYKECRALSSISHPNIVEIFDVGEFEEGGDRRPFFVMPLLNGRTLDELIRTSRHRLTVERVIDIVTQTCRGLQAAHDHGLIHRDLKPSNIFVMADNSVKIIDFGVAQAAHATARTERVNKGTLLYMAPEQLRHQPASVQSDLFSLGVTVYEALTGRHPFSGTTESEVIGAILGHVPPPASELNPSVSQPLSRVVHKALAKQPWNRFDTAREFADTLQKALRNEPIALFDPARIQPRIQTAARALEKGDVQFAGEIVGELEAEGNVDPEVTLLRTRIDQLARQKAIAQLLESARARHEEDEDPLALQKLQEVLQLDPGNVAALGLKARLDDRRSERQIDKWLQLARQHAANLSYEHAREALQNALTLRPTDASAAALLKEIEAQERDYLRRREEKRAMYHAAVEAWKNGEISHASSLMKRVVEIDQAAPDSMSLDAPASYQSFYETVRSDHDALDNGYAQARQHLAGQRFADALNVCQTFLEKYPGHALFQALKFDVEEQQRQELSGFISHVDRQLDAEEDLDAKVNLLREAVNGHPGEEHFARLLTLAEDKRDLVNAIAERARIHEERGQLVEALADLDTLQTIYTAYPGIGFEQARLRKRLEQHTRDLARGRWVADVERQLGSANWRDAIDLADHALVEFPGDGGLRELRKLGQEGLERAEAPNRPAVENTRLSVTRIIPSPPPTGRSQADAERGVEAFSQTVVFRPGASTADPAEPPDVQLVITDSPNPYSIGHTFALSTAAVVIGREGDWVPVADTGWSRQHASISCENGGFFLTDLGSSNGTRVNGVTVPTGEPRELYFGSRILIGETVLTFSSARATATPDLTGGEVDGRYILEERIRGGSKAALYAARDTRLGGRLAVKVLSPRLSAYPGYSARFEQQARLARQLLHPHICPVLDYGCGSITRPNGPALQAYFMCLALMDGGNLADRLEKGVPERRNVIEWIQRIGSALDYAHRRDIVHGDIKPTAIVFDADENPYLTDFAVIQKESGKPGFIMGAPAFMAPEHWESRSLTPAADQFSLAAVSYFLLTGSRPFEGQDHPEIRRRNFARGPLPAHAEAQHHLRPPLPRGVSHVLEKALNHASTERYGDVAEFTRALSTALIRPPRRPDAGQVFLSYHRETAAGWVNFFAVQLRARSLSVYLDTTVIVAGSFPNQLVEAIEDCSVFVCFLDEQALASKWIQYEISLAHQYSKPMIPVFFEGDLQAATAAASAPVRALLMSQGVHFQDRNADGSVADLAVMIQRCLQNS